MVVKQFKVGVEAKKYLLYIQSILGEEFKQEKMSEDFEIKIEYGYVLNKAVNEAVEGTDNDLKKINWKDLLDKKVVYPEGYDFVKKNMSGGTIKFKLRDGVSDKIDEATLLISEQLGGIRVYRALAVKLFLKQFFLAKTNQQ